jgi:hypothetical protein
MASEIGGVLRDVTVKVDLLKSLDARIRVNEMIAVPPLHSAAESLAALANLQLGEAADRFRRQAEGMRAATLAPFSGPIWKHLSLEPSLTAGFSAAISASLRSTIASTFERPGLHLAEGVQRLLEDFARREPPMFAAFAARLAELEEVEDGARGDGAATATWGEALEAGAADTLGEGTSEAPEAETLTRLYEHVLARTPPDSRTTSYRLGLAEYIAILALLLTRLDHWADRRHEEADDRLHAQEVVAEAERQETTNRLLQGILDRLAVSEGMVPEHWRRAVRTARIYVRPKAGAPVACRLAEGQLVLLVQVRNEWAKVQYADEGALCDGWLRKKYLGDLE